MLSDHIIVVIILLPPPPTTTIYYWLVFIHYETSISSYCLCKIIVIISWLLSAVLEASSFDMICIFSLWYIIYLCHNHYRRWLLCVLWILRVNTASTTPSSIVQSFMRAWFLQPEVYSCVSSEIMWLSSSPLYLRRRQLPSKIRIDTTVQQGYYSCIICCGQREHSPPFSTTNLFILHCVIRFSTSSDQLSISAFPHSSEVSTIKECHLGWIWWEIATVANGSC